MKFYNVKKRKTKKEEIKAFVKEDTTKEKGKDTVKRVKKLDIRTKEL